MLYERHELRDGYIIICPECAGHKNTQWLDGSGKKHVVECGLCYNGLVQVRFHPVDEATDVTVQRREKDADN